MKKKIVLDVDTGIDDMLTIAYLCSKKDVDLLGVSTVYGNIDVDQATQNTLSVLDLCDSEDVKVYPGSAHKMGGDAFSQSRGGAVFHGENGIGNIALSSSRTPETMDAVDFLVTAGKNNCNTTLVATGPLTNIARAIEKDLDTMRGYERIVLMGGALCVSGNVSPYAEANIYQDPKAAKIVFESGIPVTMVGLDVTSRALITREDMKSWVSGNKKLATIYNITDHYFKAHELIYPRWGGAAMHDPLAGMVAIYPDIVKTITYPVTVLETQGQEGRTVLDLQRMDKKNNYTVSVAIDIDCEQFTRELLASIEDYFA